jgi:anti-sigma regulatory factor (Ser/Thr protein kinase)
MATYQFEYSSILESEEKMLTDIELILSRHLVTGHLNRAFTLAVSEAFTNALTHGNELDPEKTVTLRVTINKTDLIADIIDQGRDALRRIADRKPAQLLSEGGRGVDLIRHYANTARFVEVESGGLLVSIHFSRRENIATKTS